MVLTDLESLGIRSVHLAGDVQKLAGDYACQINMQGLEYQIGFLCCLGSKSLREILISAFGMVAREQPTVEFINVDFWDIFPGPALQGQMLRFDSSNGTFDVRLPNGEIGEVPIEKILRVLPDEW